MQKVTVLITVGPQTVYKEYLPEAIESVLQQTYPVDEILLVADGIDVGLKNTKVKDYHYVFDGCYSEECYRRDDYQYEVYSGPIISIWKTPWNIGFAQAFNCGVGVADNDLIFYLGADDRMFSSCVADCVNAYEKNNQKDAWYACSYQIGEDVHTIPNNCAMITKNLWKWAGGFPPSAFAGPDALFLSRLMVHAPDRIIWVEDGKPNYWVRQHADQETHRQASFFLDEMNSIRNKETGRFKPNTEIVLK